MLAQCCTEAVTEMVMPVEAQPTPVAEDANNLTTTRSPSRGSPIEGKGDKRLEGTEAALRSVASTSDIEAQNSGMQSSLSDATSSLLGHSPSPQHSTGRMEGSRERSSEQDSEDNKSNMHAPAGVSKVSRERSWHMDGHTGGRRGKPGEKGASREGSRSRSPREAARERSRSNRRDDAARASSEADRDRSDWSGAGRRGGGGAREGDDVGAAGTWRTGADAGPGEKRPPLPEQRPLPICPAVAHHLDPLPQLLCTALRVPQEPATLALSSRFLQHLALQEAMDVFESGTEALIGKVQQGVIEFSDADEGILKVAKALGDVCECLEVLCAPRPRAWWLEDPQFLLKQLPEVPLGDAAALRCVARRGILLRCMQMVCLPPMIVNAIVESGIDLDTKERRSLERRLGTHLHSPLRVRSPLHL
jgi:hypothetical protein